MFVLWLTSKTCPPSLQHCFIVPIYSSQSPALAPTDYENLSDYSTQKLEMSHEGGRFKGTRDIWWSRCSSVSVVTKRRVERSRNCGSIWERRKSSFSSPKRRRRLWVPSTLLRRHVVPALMRLGLELDRLPSSSADVKNRVIHATFQYGFRALTGIIWHFIFCVTILK